MLNKLRNWFSGKPAVEGPRSRTTAANAPPRRAVKTQPGRSRQPVGAGADPSGGIEGLRPGKTVASRRRFIREDSGTHETLKILDDSIIDDPGDQGLDPYNTGCFDRSKTWDKPFSTK